MSSQIIKIIISTAVFACTSEPNLSIKVNIEKGGAVPTSDKAQVIIKNNTRHEVFYTVGMEFKINEEWWELVDNIENPSFEYVLVERLKPDSTSLLTFDPQKIKEAQVELDQVNLCRVFVRYAYSLKQSYSLERDLKLKDVSESFSLE